MAVLGSRPTGLCAMMCARLYRPACVVAVEPDPARRAGPGPGMGGPGSGAWGQTLSGSAR